MEHEATKEEKRNQDDEDPDACFQGGAPPVFGRPGGSHREENGNAAEGINDREQSKKRARRRMWQCAQELSESMSGIHGQSKTIGGRRRHRVRLGIIRSNFGPFSNRSLIFGASCAFS